MACVILKNVEKQYPNGFKAVHGINLEIKDGEFMVFVGPSGCAKSTTLRMIAGLEEITGGEIYIGDTLVNDVAPKDRGIAMVFQNYALYPHMTVYENMAFGLKLRKISKQEIDKRVKEAAEKLEITELLNRKPKEMSGGQRQRVALGRAIVRKPAVFLMDEPLSNLDAKLREHMRVELVRIHQSLGTTSIYVTHDQTEAMTMGTKICLLDKGVIQQFGKPEEFYNKPANLFVAKFIGSPTMNIINGTIKDGMFVSDSGIVKIKPDERLKAYEGQKISVGIRSERFLSEKNNENSISAKIDVIEMLGKDKALYVKLEDNTQLIITVPSYYKYEIGETHNFTFDTDALHYFNEEGNRI